MISWYLIIYQWVLQILQQKMRNYNNTYLLLVVF